MKTGDRRKLDSLAGQVAIVTGGAQGIGGATARRLAEEGARVLVVDLDPRASTENVETIQAAGGVAEFFEADVGEHRAVQAMIEQALAYWDRLDILVNNAYWPPPKGGAVETSEQDWDRGLAVLVKAHFLAAKYAVPAMAREGGSIVNVASVHGQLGAPDQLIYETGKSAVIGLSRQMATQYGPLGIRVNAICPGHIVTERLQQQWDTNPSGLRFFEQQYPLRRCGRPVDIANAIAFLCSDQASFITGHALVVDGGLSIQLQEDLGVHLGRYIQAHPDTQL
jgi:NAD(P)-dependent dehydrogenase (short-subunit alcohol dehydrogenase family)